MTKPILVIDSHEWTGEDDYVEVEIIPAAIGLLGLAMLQIGNLI